MATTRQVHSCCHPLRSQSTSERRKVLGVWKARRGVGEKGGREVLGGMENAHGPGELGVLLALGPRHGSVVDQEGVGLAPAPNS